MKYALTLIALLFAGAALADGEPVDHKTSSEPIHEHNGFDMAVADINELVDSANFLVKARNSLCSGTLVSIPHRLVLTAHHCLDKAIRVVEKEVNEGGEVTKKKVEVFDDVTVEQTYYDGVRSVGSSTYKARIIGYDAPNDLAVLQIRAEKIPNKIAAHIFADHHGEVNRADAVWAFGNPLGLENSVSFGHVASTTRLFKKKGGEEVTYIQTDAGMLTFGNSGGALMKGQYLIGVPSLTVPGTPVSLSVPYTHVQELLTEHCYEEVWNDDPAQTFKECDDERQADAEDKEESVKDLLRKLVDNKAEPIGFSGPQFIFDDMGKPYGIIGVSSQDEYNTLMEQAQSCTIDGFDACMAPKPIQEQTKPESSTLQQLMQDISNALWQ